MNAADGRVVSNFIAAALAGEELRITGDGKATRSFQYVTDCIKGLYALMNSDYGDGPVNIGNDGEFTIKELADIATGLVCEVTGKPKVPVTYHARPVDDPLVRCPQITLAKEKLGWKPVVPLREGLRKTIEWHMNES